MKAFLFKHSVLPYCLFTKKEFDSNASIDFEKDAKNVHEEVQIADSKMLLSIERPFKLWPSEAQAKKSLKKCVFVFNMAV